VKPICECGKEVYGYIEYFQNNRKYGFWACKECTDEWDEMEFKRGTQYNVILYPNTVEIITPDSIRYPPAWRNHVQESK
jgi:hypothetical protein